MLNEVKLIGNLGRDPEIRSTQNGDPIANITIATSERWKDKATGERKERTEWHRVVIFGGAAKIVEQYLKKGSRVFIEGMIRTRKWTDKDGAEKYSTEIHVTNIGGKILLLDKAEGGGSGTTTATDGYGEGDSRPYAPPIDDEIPFSLLLPWVLATAIMLSGVVI